MPVIYVGFSRPKKPTIVSKSIMFFIDAEFSHTYIKFRSASLEEELIYQASGLAVNFCGSDNFYINHESIFEIPIEISEEVYKKTLKYCVRNAGTPYGVKQLLGFVIYFVAKQLGFSLKNNPYSDGKTTQVCSETVGLILEECLDLSLQEKEDLLTPKDIYDFLVNRGA